MGSKKKFAFDEDGAEPVKLTVNKSYAQRYVERKKAEELSHRTVLLDI